MNNWIAFAASAIMAVLNGAAWGNIGVAPSTATGITAIVGTLLAIFHLSPASAPPAAK
jgi:hypothetical protein